EPPEVLRLRRADGVPELGPPATGTAVVLALRAQLAVRPLEDAGVGVGVAGVERAVPEHVPRASLAVRLGLHAVLDTPVLQPPAHVQARGLLTEGGVLFERRRLSGYRWALHRRDLGGEVLQLFPGHRGYAGGHVHQTRAAVRPVPGVVALLRPRP